LHYISSDDIYGDFMENKTDTQAIAPLSETTYFILLSLAAGPRHGYAIMKDVREVSGGRVELSTGTLYTALKRMLDQGWIHRIVDPENAKDGRERKAYRLTHLGEQTLDAEVERLQRLVSVARMRSLGRST
jgi:DNA-binding PadR family transcriptional regulator